MILPRRYLLTGRGANRFIEARDYLALADLLIKEIPCEPPLAVHLAAQAWATGRVEYGPHVEEINLDEFVRREHGNWAGVTDAVAWVRERRADAEPDAEPDAEVPLFGGPL